MQPEGDLWDHTMLVLELLPADPSFTLAFAALLARRGQALHARSFTRAGTLSPPRTGRRADRRSTVPDLKLSNAERERITWLVAFHQYLGEAKKLRESKLKRILAEPASKSSWRFIGPTHWRRRATPSTSTTVPTTSSTAVRPDQSAATHHGHDLVRHGLQPGAHFAVILETIREAQLEGKIQSKREALEWVDYWLESESWPADAPL